MMTAWDEALEKLGWRRGETFKEQVKFAVESLDEWDLEEITEMVDDGSDWTAEDMTIVTAAEWRLREISSGGWAARVAEGED